MFPDGGYVLGDDYGEIAHWEPFVMAYAEHIATTFTGPLDRGEAAQHAAFLLGVASHGMADQVYDSMFMRTARVLDAAGWSDTTFDSFDTATDALTVDLTKKFEMVSPQVPWGLPELYQRKLMHVISQSSLDFAESLLATEVIGYGQRVAMSEPQKIAEYRMRYPWAAAHLMDAGEMGSPPCQARVVSAYLQAVWDRLHGVGAQQNFVIATLPSDGAAGHPSDPSVPQSHLVIAFGHGIGQATFAGADAVVVTDDTGKRYAVDLAPWREPSNLLRIVPKEPWAPARDFTVTLAAGLRSIDGLVLAAPLRFHFSTRAAATLPAPGADPTPHLGEPPLRPDPEAGGCSIEGGAAAVPHGTSALACLAGALALALFLYSRRRR